MPSASKGEVTVAWLVQRHVALSWQEAVALVLEIAEVLGRSIPPSIPPYQEVAVTSDGSVRFLRTATRRGDPLTTLVDILRALLPTDSPAEVWDIASTAAPDSPSHDTVDRLAAALRALEQDDPGRREILAGLYKRTTEFLPDEELEGPTPTIARADAKKAGDPALVLRMLPTSKIRTPIAIEPHVSTNLIETVRRHGLIQPLLVRPSENGVYELVAGRGWLEAAHAAGIARLPCRVCELDDDDVAVMSDLDRLAPTQRTSAASPSEAAPFQTLEPALVEISDSLNAASSCWELTTEGPDRPYTRTVSAVTGVELQRAAWLVDDVRLLTQRPAPKKTNRNLGVLLERVFQLTRPERLLNGTKLLANLSEASVMLQVDERMAVLAFGGLVQATLSLVRTASTPVVRCEVSTRGRAVIFALSQDSVEVPPALVERFFDESFHERPGGSGTAVALAVTKMVMELHGGRATVESLDPVGCRVSAQLPFSGPRPEGG